LSRWAVEISSALLAIRLVGGDRDAVLGLEALDDLAVVGPVRRQGDDVERALLLGGCDEPVHAAEGLGGGGGLRVDGARGTGRCRGLLVGGRGTGDDGSGGEADDGQRAGAPGEGVSHS
jgi:hypothetical protein